MAAIADRIVAGFQPLRVIPVRRASLMAGPHGRAPALHLGLVARFPIAVDRVPVLRPGGPFGGHP